jgi:hypothetical protein
MKLMVIGFPKSGTTTITRVLEASGLKSAHWQDESGRYVGALIYGAIFSGLDPFAHLSDFDAITQADVCLPSLRLNFWPNLDFAILNVIRRADPECLFLLNYRRPEAICKSMETWTGMQERFRVSDIPGLPRGIGGKREELIMWIENHFDACRNHFSKDERFLEIDIESADAPDRLGKALGIPIVGWGDFKPDLPS